MTKAITFVSRLDKNIEKLWLDALKKEMPEENIVLFSDLEQKDYDMIELAIVADPNPDDIVKLKNLKWIHSVWAGVEKLVASLPKDSAPIVRLIDPELTRTMAEAVLAWSLYIQRDMPAYKDQQNRQIWQQRPYRPLTDMQVGIVGLGTLGKAAADLLIKVGFNVCSWSRNEKNFDDMTCFSGEAGLDQLLSTSDIIVLLLPLTSDTKNLLDSKRFASVKKSAALINFARGAIIETKALLKALQDNTLSHAVLDVFINEPVSQSCPYWHHPKVTVLPHIAAPTSVISAAKTVAKNVTYWRKADILPPVVNRQREY